MLLKKISAFKDNKIMLNCNLRTHLFLKLTQTANLFGVIITQNG